MANSLSDDLVIPVDQGMNNNGARDEQKSERIGKWREESRRERVSGQMDE